MSPDASVTRSLGAIDLSSTLRALAILPHDPTVRMAPGRFERATLTPDGAASIRVTWKEPAPHAPPLADATATVEAWGEGAEWVIERADRLLGLEDDLAGFEPGDAPMVRRAWARKSGARLTRSGTLWHDLAWLIVQQRVRFIDAANHWRAMVHAFGEPGPGPVDLRTPPLADRVRTARYEEFHPFGIEQSRSETMIRCARELSRMERVVDGDFTAVAPRLASLRGVGPWTMGGLEALTWGSSDAVILGDVHLPRQISWWLAGERDADDDRMLELLNPWRPHRYRIVQLALSSGESIAPRRGPKRW